MRLVTYNFFGIISFSYSTSLCCKTFKKIYIRKKSYREKCIRSHHLWTQNCLLGITYLINICNQCLFTLCAGVIKQTLNYSFSTIQYTCFIISSIMSKLCLLFWLNKAWTDGTNLSLIDEVAMIKWVTWENYIYQTSLVTYVFYCTFQVTIMWRTIEKSLKKILRQLLLLRNHLKVAGCLFLLIGDTKYPVALFVMFTFHFKISSIFFSAFIIQKQIIHSHD